MPETHTPPESMHSTRGDLILREAGDDAATDPGTKKNLRPQFLVGLYLQGSQVKRGFPPEAADKWGYRTFRILGIALFQIDWSKTCMNHRGNEAENTPEL